MNNGVGRTPPALLPANRTALGTDGIGSDMFEEGRAGFFRLHEEDLSVGPSWALERLAAGADFAGRVFGEPLLGQIAVGAPADLVLLAYDAPAPLDEASLAGHWIFGVTSRCVRDVMVNGEIVVRDHRLARVDEASLAATAREQAARLWSRMETI
jgi:cytosine/adenosine deaminase-related metal-dependent hydrolase